MATQWQQLLWCNASFGISSLASAAETSCRHRHAGYREKMWHALLRRGVDRLIVSKETLLQRNTQSATRAKLPNFVESNILISRSCQEGVTPTRTDSRTHSELCRSCHHCGESKLNSDRGFAHRSGYKFVRNCVWLHESQECHLKNRRALFVSVGWLRRSYLLPLSVCNSDPT